MTNKNWYAIKHKQIKPNYLTIYVCPFIISQSINLSLLISINQYIYLHETVHIFISLYLSLSLYIYIYIYIIYYWPIDILIRVLINGLGDQSSIPGQVMPKTQKMVLDAFLLNTQHYKVQIKGKWSNPVKEVALSPLHLGMVLFTNPSVRAGYDTRSIFKQSLTSLNSEFSFS